MNPHANHHVGQAWTSVVLSLLLPRKQVGDTCATFEVGALSYACRKLPDCAAPEVSIHILVSCVGCVNS